MKIFSGVVYFLLHRKVLYHLRSCADTDHHTFGEYRLPHVSGPLVPGDASLPVQLLGIGNSCRIVFEQIAAECCQFTSASLKAELNLQIL